MMKSDKTIILSILAAAVTLASCGPLGKYQSIVSKDTETITAPDWKTIYTDPCLQNLIDTALVRNLDMKMAYEHIQQADAELLAAKLAYIPTLNLGPTITSSFYGKGFGTQSWEYSVPAKSSWQLNFFTLTNTKNYAKAALEQSRDFAMATRSSLIGSVANTYFTLLMLKDEMAAAENMEEIWKRSVETVKALMNNGMADNVAVNQYVANYNKVRAKMEELKSQILKTEDALALILNYEPGTTFPLGTLDSQFIPESMTSMIPISMLSARPDVQAAERDVEISFYNTKQAWLNFFPKLYLNGSVGMVSPETGALTPITALASVGAGLTAPILNAGTNRANLKKAESMQREARMVFDQTLLKAGMEVNDAINSYDGYKKMEEYYQLEVNALKQACIDTDYMMKNSSTKTYLDVLAANTSYFDAVLAQIGAKAKKLQSAVTLYQALGGGSN